MNDEMMLVIGAPIALLLLLISGITLATGKGKFGKPNKWLSSGSLALATLIAGLVGLPFWLPIPYIDDSLAPWTQVLILWALTSALVSFSLLRAETVEVP